MICWLVRNGVPFDVAHCMNEAELMAFWVTFASFETDKQWNWDLMAFEER